MVGTSKLKTWLTSGMSRPRAATSEQTRDDFAGRLKASSEAMRAAGPCRHAARRREAVLGSDLCKQRHVALAVAEDDGVLEVLGARSARRSASRLSDRRRAGRGSALRDRGGRRRRARHFDAHRIVQEGSVRRVISGGMVAEKNSVWRVNGSSLQMRSMSG
jgi:hypothetical protein